MAEKNSHETWSVTDSSRERADRSRGKPPVAKADSGLGGDTEPLDRDCLCQVSDCEGGREGEGGRKEKKTRCGVPALFIADKRRLHNHQWKLF